MTCACPQRTATPMIALATLTATMDCGDAGVDMRELRGRVIWIRYVDGAAEAAESPRVSTTTKVTVKQDSMQHDTRSRWNPCLQTECVRVLVRKTSRELEN